MKFCNDLKYLTLVVECKVLWYIICVCNDLKSQFGLIILGENLDGYI